MIKSTAEREQLGAAPCVRNRRGDWDVSWLFCLWQFPVCFWIKHRKPQRCETHFADIAARLPRRSRSLLSRRRLAIVAAIIYIENQWTMKSFLASESETSASGERDAPLSQGIAMAPLEDFYPVKASSSSTFSLINYSFVLSYALIILFSPYAFSMSFCAPIIYRSSQARHAKGVFASALLRSLRAAFLDFIMHTISCYLFRCRRKNFVL